MGGGRYINDYKNRIADSKNSGLVSSRPLG